MMHTISRPASLLAVLAVLVPSMAVLADGPPVAPPTANVTPAPEPVLPEVNVEAPEPRYVAPTLRDRIGRIWAPVYINGKGPYRLVLDTGASHSAVTAAVAASLGISLQDSTHVLLRGVTGTANVPTIRVATLIVGDLQIEAPMLPIVPDALGGAEGILGTEGMSDKRIFIDFRHDKITIMRSHSYRAKDGFVTIPVELTADHLLVAQVHVGGVRVKAIIDTGGQATVANPALREALLHRRSDRGFSQDQIVGTTLEVQNGLGTTLPAIDFGRIEIRNSRVTISDLKIFEQWHLTTEPAMLIGMDTLGLLDTLIIDYKRRELQVELRSDIMKLNPDARRGCERCGNI